MKEEHKEDDFTSWNSSSESKLREKENMNYEEFKEEDEEEEEEIEVNASSILYNDELTFDENFEDGSIVKFILLPIYKEEPEKEFNYTPLLNAGAKWIKNKKFKMSDLTGSLEYLVLDVHSIFSLHLLKLQRYNPDFFDCQERVLFETLIIKYRSFKFKPYFFSYANMFKEIGIKEHKARTIVEKFVSLGIINKVRKASFVNNRSYNNNWYNLYPKRIIELLPKIYLNADSEFVDSFEKYLKPTLRK